MDNEEMYFLAQCSYQVECLTSGSLRFDVRQHRYGYWDIKTNIFSKEYSVKGVS